MSNTRNKLLLRFDRALSNSFWKQIGILIGILLLSLLLSYLFLSFSGCEWRQFCHDNGLKTWLLPIYLLIDTNALNRLYMGGNVTGWMLIASILTYLCGLLIFNGMLVGVITNAIVDRVESHRNGLYHYLKSDHHIIMGYDQMVPSIIEDIFSKDKEAYILLLSAYDAKKINEKLKKSVAKKQLDQIIVNYGQRTASEYYDEIHLETAKEIYIVGNRSLPSHDATNIECVDSVTSYLKDHKSEQMPKRITCVFEDLDTYAAFKTTEIFDNVRALNIEFVPYNFYTGWAHQVFINRSYKEKNDPLTPIPYPRIYDKGIGPKDSRYMHLVFVGTTYFSVSFAMEAAHMFHFPNFNEDTKQPKTRITFIDQNMDKEMQLFLTRNRHFFEVQSYLYQDLTSDSTHDCQQASKSDFLDVEFEFIKGDVYSEVVQNLLTSWAKDIDHQYLYIFLAMADQRNNFMMGMNMPDEVYDNAIPVFIRQDDADNLVTNLRKADDKDFDYNIVEDGKLKTSKRKGRYANLYPFGMEDMAYCSNEISMKRAKLINYLYTTADYSTYRFAEPSVLDATPSKTLWADVERYWQELTVALKWSNLYCAYNIPCKMASLRAMRGLKLDDTSHDQDPLSEEEIQILAAVEHNRWNVEKLLMGFRRPKPEEDKYEFPDYKGSLKNNKKLFIHHDIRPFSDLDNVKLLDSEIVKYIPWILKITEID